MIEEVEAKIGFETSTVLNSFHSWAFNYPLLLKSTRTAYIPSEGMSL